jgi:hypothetical protein
MCRDRALTRGGGCDMWSATMILGRAAFTRAAWLVLALLGMQGHAICMLVHSHACRDVPTEDVCSGQCTASHNDEHESHADEFPASTSDPCCCRCVSPQTYAGIPDGYSPRRRAEQRPVHSFLTFDTSQRCSTAACSVSLSRSKHLASRSPAGIDRAVVLLI